MSIYIATTNQNKLREYRHLLKGKSGFTIRNDSSTTITDVVEDGVTYQENSEKKAISFFNDLVKQGMVIGGVTTILADDSGLEIDVLDGAPGIHSRRYWTGDMTEGDDDFNNNEMIKRLNEFPSKMPWVARYKSALTRLIALDEFKSYFIQTVVGVQEGVIIPFPCGSNGFAYDKHFACIYKNKIVILAQLTDEEKLSISSRHDAINKLLQHDSF